MNKEIIEARINESMHIHSAISRLAMASNDEAAKQALHKALEYIDTSLCSLVLMKKVFDDEVLG